ncbi:uncharacterized protein VP01_5699g1 [Puccinia sorghi]|uniref:Retrotransposon gag domain-containing protein n=1 Tax=Puccinia sorghi TaxID=27349 RepID=A0A0L6UIP5_9BASI|nr:uncharacterized protein VP01_5699g1 [Puccinia sorghi]
MMCFWPTEQGTHSPSNIPAPPPTSSPNSMILAKPQPLNGTRGAAAKSFVGKILLHTITYPDQFVTNSGKVAFAVSFMTDYTSTWSQLYLMKIFNTEEVAFNKFLDDFKSSFFDQNHQHRAETRTLTHQNPRTVLLSKNRPYTIYPPNWNSVNLQQEFNSNTCTVGWANTPLMSLYQHGLKEKVQLAVVMSNIQFTSLQTMQEMALKAGQTREGIQNGRPTPIPPASSSAPATDPNAMDLLAFQRGPHNQLSDAEQARRVQLNLFSRCGQARNVSRGCSNRSRKLQGCQQYFSSSRISELQAKINRICASLSTTNAAPTTENASLSKIGGAQAKGRKKQVFVSGRDDAAERQSGE